MAISEQKIFIPKRFALNWQHIQLVLFCLNLEKRNLTEQNKGKPVPAVG